MAQKDGNRRHTSVLEPLTVMISQPPAGSVATATGASGGILFQCVGPSMVQYRHYVGLHAAIFVLRASACGAAAA